MLFRRAENRASPKVDHDHHVIFADRLGSAENYATSNTGSMLSTLQMRSTNLLPNDGLSMYGTSFNLSRRSVQLRPLPAPECKSIIKVDKFNGSGCIETFLLKFEHIARYKRWADQDKAAHLGAALTGSAGLIL